MRFLADRSDSDGIEGPWTEVGTAEAKGDDIGEPVLRQVGESAGLYRIRPEDLSDQGYAYYWLALDGRIERRHFPGLS